MSREKPRTRGVSVLIAILLAAVNACESGYATTPAPDESAQVRQYPGMVPAPSIPAASVSAAAPTGGGPMKNGDAASGDLAGSYPGPTVAKLQGVAVGATAPTTGQVLKYNGTAWAPGVAGVSGYEIVTNDLGSIPNGSGIIGTGASCPSGKVAVGGGFYNVPSPGLSILRNRPAPGGSAWSVILENSSGAAVSVTLYAICVASN